MSRWVLLAFLLLAPALAGAQAPQPAETDCDSESGPDLTLVQLVECLGDEPENQIIGEKPLAKAIRLHRLALEAIERSAKAGRNGEDGGLVLKRRAPANASPPSSNYEWALGEVPNDPVVKRWYVGRKLADKESFAAEPFSTTVPFLVSFARDSEADTNNLTLLGDVKYDLTPTKFETKQWLTGSFDSRTGKDAKDSDITLGYKFENNSARLEGNEYVGLKTEAGLRWNTDRKFDRSGYSAFVKLTPYSSKLNLSNLYPVGAWHIGWQPTLEFNAGNVSDAAGNEKLELIHQQGGYVRAVPAVDVSFQLPINEKDDRFTVNLSYKQTYDLTRGWDRGLFTANANYPIGKSVFLSAVFRKGRKDTTFEEIRETLLGIGINY